MSAQGEFARIASEDGRAAVVTAIEGPEPGAKLLVRPDGTTEGGLGDAALDVAAVQAADELMWAERSELRELLAPAEATAGPRRQDEASDQAPTSWMRPRADESRPPSRPFRTATTSAMIESAVSSGVTAPRSSPIGAAMLSSSSSSRPAATSRSRRLAWARRLPIAPT